MKPASSIRTPRKLVGAMVYLTPEQRRHLRQQLADEGLAVSAWLRVMVLKKLQEAAPDADDSAA
jgi:hypothetical protein